MPITFPSSELLLSRSRVALDCETTGIEWWKHKVFGYSLSWWGDRGDLQSAYIDLREPGAMRWTKDVVPRLQHIVNHHIKFDVHMLRSTGINVPLDRIDCTMIREAIIDENKYEYSLEALSQKYLKRGKKEIWTELAALFGGPPTREEQIKNLPRAPKKLVGEYANIDSGNALEIFDKQTKIIEEEKLERVAQLERELLAVVIRMEFGGVRVDVDAADRAMKHLAAEIKKQQKELDRLAGYAVNVNSTAQAKKLLGVYQDEEGWWWTRDGVRLEPTDSGKSASLKTDKLYQSSLLEAKYIAEIRGMIKAHDVFLGKYIMQMSHRGYVHANINQTKTEDGDGTYTGRFSITQPALQQIHKRNKKMAAIVRSCFIPDEGCEWGCYDWSQKDFRIFAHYVNDPKINRIYEENPEADFHRTVADLTGLPRDRDQKTGGANAKQMNLGLIFGMGSGKMAKEMGLPYTVDEKGFLRAGPEAEAKFSLYHTNIPGAKRLKDSVASVARSRGYITTQLGRRLRFPNPSHAYKAAGILFQGQAAESMKVKMVEIDRTMQTIDHDSRLMVVVHDEFDFSMQLERDRAFDLRIKEILETFDGNPLKYRIPIRSDFGLGPNWWEASK